MTQPVNEPSDAGDQAATDFRIRQLARRPPVLANFSPICFRAAVGPAVRPVVGGTPFDPEVHRVHYVAEDEGNNVYWDQWDPSYDTSVYATNLYEQTNDATEGLVIAGVALLKRGLYSIYAIVDVQETFNGMVSLGSNWDQGQGAPYYVNNRGDTPYWGDHYAIQVNHWRWVEESNPDTTPPISFFPDFWFGGEAETVEIILNVNTNIDGFGITGGTSAVAFPHTPTPGGDVWIPGGYDGAWGFVPQLIVAYWGDPGEVNGMDPDWPATIGLSRE